MSDLTRPPTNVAASHPELVPFGDALRDARERSGLSMGQVARAIGATVVAVSDIERGRMRPSDDDVRAFASTIGADPVPLLALLPPVTRPNPFALWLPMYGAGVVGERPWWRCVAGDSEWTRCDGARSGELPDSAYTERMGYGGWRAPDKTVFAHLDAYDAAHPMPAPPPMAGQVWADPEWGQQVVGPISPAGHISLTYVAFPGPYTNTEIMRSWPPKGVLVDGPTPWGRGVPWAPPGWKP